MSFCYEYRKHKLTVDLIANRSLDKPFGKIFVWTTCFVLFCFKNLGDISKVSQYDRVVDRYTVTPSVC